MIYLGAGVVCASIMVAYGIGLYRGYTIGYNDAIEDVIKLTEDIQKNIPRNKIDEA